MKTCTLCKKEKELSEFHKRNEKYVSRCAECTNRIGRETHHKNREKNNAKRTKFYYDDRENQLAKSKKKYAENREKIRERANAQNQTPERRAAAKIRAQEWVKNNKERHKNKCTEWRHKNPHQRKAHQHVMWAVKLGVLIKPDECQVCKIQDKLHAHHHDYSKPLEVEFLCYTCHMHKHGKMLYTDSKERNGISSRQFFISNKTEGS